LDISKLPMDEWVSGAEWLPEVGELLTREQCQKLAIRVAYRGLGNVSPNPLVGAVIVDSEHRFLGAGAHEKYRSHHAEINAIRNATDLSPLIDNLFKGAIMYVTLEPCAHTRNTPPCALTLVERGFAKIVFGVVDPNPAVNGKGERILEGSGIQTEVDEKWGVACSVLAETFIHGVKKRRPFVGLKAAQTLDGSIARAGDERSFITGERARQYGHFLRVYYDGIVVGRNTLIQDNPTLDPRTSLIEGRLPWRIVLDPDLTALKARPLSELNMLKRESEKVLWVIDTANAADPLVAELESWGAVAVSVSRKGSSFDLDELSDILFDRGIHSILLEGGAGVYDSWLCQNRVNRIHLFIAPKLFFGGKKISIIQDQDKSWDMDLHNVALNTLGSDLLMEGDLL
jgi:diaminohydroxyphosphoribosylaminopyrimidine deaminase / 5-amino-6-(5-phosphoribosylamino)uracil reductase